MRKGFSMLMAIAVIIVMATIAAFVMSLSGKVVKTTTVQYQREQAILYAKSYTEFAIMAVQAHSRATNCVQTIKGTIGTLSDGGYRVRTHISYIGTPTEIGTCPANRQLGTVIPGRGTPLTVIIDAYVDYRDLDHPDSMNYTVHRRTVQKI